MVFYDLIVQDTTALFYEVYKYVRDMFRYMFDVLLTHSN